MLDELSGDFLQKLRGFFFVAQTGSFSKAAEKMHRNQSTISYQIKSLEEELDTTLFKRNPSGVVLTEQGRILFEKARALFISIAEIQEEMKNPHKLATGSVSFHCSPMPLEVFIIPLLKELHDNFPLVHFNINPSSGIKNMLKKLYDGEVDFCIGPIANLPEHFVYNKLYSAPFCLIAHKSLLLPESVSLEELASLPHISLMGIGAITMQIDKVFSDNNLKINTRHTATTVKLQYEMVCNKFGIAIIDATSYKPSEEVQKISLDSYFPAREIGIIYKKNSFIPQQGLEVMKFFSAKSILYNK